LRSRCRTPDTFASSKVSRASFVECMTFTVFVHIWEKIRTYVLARAFGRAKMQWARAPASGECVFGWNSVRDTPPYCIESVFGAARFEM
jgi:hypothetical protein